MTDYAPRIGMRDLKAHSLSWIAGVVYIGDGTNGATDSVYFECANASLIVPSTSGGGQVPVLGADTRIGATYIADVEKHYSRKVVRKCTATLVSVNPSTANSMVAVIAPVRGCGQAGDTTAFWTATTAAPTMPATLSMAGSKTMASWESGTLDLTPFIAGGSGAKQNEFNISKDGESTATTWGGGDIDLTGISPCAFVVSGKNSTAALRGAYTHYIVIEQVVDFLDFVGGNSVAVPEAFPFARYTQEELRALAQAADSATLVKSSAIWRDLQAAITSQ